MRGTMTAPGLNFRRHLLATASAAVLAAAGTANAGDADHPEIWINLGAHYEHMTGAGDIYAPPFVKDWSSTTLTSPADIEKLNVYGYGADGGISFEPEGTKWIFSAAVRFGRSSTHRKAHQQSALPTVYIKPTHPYPIPIDNFEQTSASLKDAYTVLDFQAGKDVGLGSYGSSVISAGLRFAQFDTKLGGDIYARPDVAITSYEDAFGYHIPLKYFHEYSGHDRVRREFRGLGPSLSWNASAPVFQNDESAITFDWGLNAAALFGRQKTRVDHKTTGTRYVQWRLNLNHPPQYGYINEYSHHTNPPDRSRSIIVPNVGGFAGFSFRYIDAKISVGYRADFFINAIDGGFDTRHSVTRGFHGPFASISIGVSPSDF